MRESFLLALFANICLSLFAFEIQGDPKLWSKENFLTFDQVGDGLSHTGDISSVFSFIEGDNLFLRITFDDMYSRKHKVDNFKNQNIQIQLTNKTDDTKLLDKNHSGKYISHITLDVSLITNLVSTGLLNITKDSLT